MTQGKPGPLRQDLGQIPGLWHCANFELLMHGGLFDLVKLV